MTTPVKAIEGTWEEVVAHAPELAGHRVCVVVLPDDGPVPKAGVAAPDASPLSRALREINARSLRMSPKPDLRDYLREGRSGDMYGYAPSE
jgi:hypothetical protein